jgi:uncharacterized protein (DUF983 family)
MLNLFLQAWDHTPLLILLVPWAELCFGFTLWVHLDIWIHCFLALSGP